jgi:hypothetical protein
MKVGDKKKSTKEEQEKKVAVELYGILIVGLVVGLIVIGLIGYLGERVDKANAKIVIPTVTQTPVKTPETTETPRKAILPIGTKAHLKGPTLVATSESADEALSDAIIAGDEIGINRMIVSGEVLSINDNPEVLVLKNEWPGRTKIRILTGKYRGETGWVAYEELS